MILRLSLLLLVCSLAVAADETPRVRAVKYYAEGLDRALLQLRAGTQLIRACGDRLKRACDARQRKQAADGNLLRLLDALTLFPQRLADDPAAGIRKRHELQRKVTETSDALLAEAGRYDRLLFARYGATLVACPNGSAAQYRESLDELERIDYTRFQSLEGDTLAATMRTTREEESAAAEMLRGLPAETCVAARELGEFLMQLMYSKLQPWSGEDRRVANQERQFDFNQPKKREPVQENRERDRELAHAVAGNFVSVVATELQLVVHPESEVLIKSIPDRVQ